MRKDSLKKFGHSFLVAVFILTQSGISPAQAAKTKVNPSEQAVDAEIAFYSGDFPVAISAFDSYTRDQDKDYALWKNQLGSIYLAAGDYKQALNAFLEAYYLMNDVEVFSELESRAVALTGKESEKAYKGDPYEKVYNSFYVSLLLAMDNEYDNAMAAIKNGLLCDSDVTGGLYKSDATLLYLMGARLEALRDNPSSSEEYFRKAQEAYRLSHPTNRGVVSDEQAKMDLMSEKQKELDKRLPKPKEVDPPEEDGENDGSTNFAGKKNDDLKTPKKSKKVIALEEEIGELEGAIKTLQGMREENNKEIATDILREVVDTQNNVLLVVELGRGPVKYPIGKYGHIAIFTSKPAHVRRVAVTVDGGPGLSQSLANNDTYYQASTRGGRRMDRILKGKAEFKQTTAQISYQLSQLSQEMSNQANQLQQQAAFYGTSSSAATGAAYAAVGIAVLSMAFAVGSAMANPAADVRHWSLLPGEIQIIPLDVKSGSHHFRLQVFDANDVEIAELGKEFDADISGKNNIIMKRIVE